jgi:thiol-disulfide isomerase/thioredoxin/uncharacterized membrane protein YphA (DoxX/SURF4 family)
MEVVLVVLRVVLAVVFVVAGLAKLVDLAGSRRAVEDFGVPRALASAVGTLLPLVELAVAVALIGRGSAPFGALAALVLLGAFIAVIARSMARGEQPDCHCFGQLHSAPAGGLTLVRNVVLGAFAAVIAIAGPGPSAGAWLASLTANQRGWVIAGTAAALLFAGQAYLIWQLLRRHGTVLARLHELETAAPGVASGLAVGELAPGFDLPGLGGGRLSLEGLLSAGRRVLLVFTDPFCGPCQALLPRLAGWQDEHFEQLTVVLISSGAAQDNAPARDVHGLRHVALQTEREIEASYRVAGTPAAILVAADGRVASRPLFGAGQIAAAVEGIAAESTHTPASSRDDVPAELSLLEAQGTQTVPGGRERQPTGALAGAVAAVSTAAVVAPAASGASARTAAEQISAELGHLSRKILPAGFAANQALRSARITTPGKPVPVPPAALTAWHQRLHDIDQAHARITNVNGAADARAAALDVLSVLRQACQNTELAISSSSPTKRAYYARAQQRNTEHLQHTLQPLINRLRKAGATHL